MSDEQEFQSKRERQKARRAEKLEREAKEAVVADRRRQMTYGLVIVLVVALIGFLVYRVVQNRIEIGEAEERALAKLGELGCQTDDRRADLGGTHITPGQEGAEPPVAIYQGEVASSGRHLPSVAASGIYDVSIDPRLTTHNLEHGYIVAWYSPDAPAEEVDALKAWGRDAIGDSEKLIVAEYYEALPNEASVAFSAWFRSQTCDTFDADVANTFVNNHYGINGEGPEKAVPVHNSGGQGVITPEDEDLLFDPLGDSGDDAGVDPTVDATTTTDAPTDPATDAATDAATDGVDDAATDAPTEQATDEATEEATPSS